jgi:hypothetical protein
MTLLFSLKQIDMKKTIFTAVFTLVSFIAMAQKDSGFGIKVGVNYNQNSDLRFADLQAVGEDLIAGSDGKIGYHVGVFGKLDFPKFYLKPELLYTKTQSSYNIENVDRVYDVSKIDLPVLLGYKIIGPLSIFAGPSLKYILNQDLEDVELNDVEDNFTVGLQSGIGVNLGNIGIDVRYERGFTSNEATFIDSNITNVTDARIDARPSQIIFGISLKL